jgi:hypothetical protein
VTLLMLWNFYTIVALLIGMWNRVRIN